MPREPRRVVALQAVADPVRLDLLEALSLSAGPLTTTELSTAVPAARRGVQAHLRRLHEAGWVEHVDGEGRHARWRRADSEPVVWTEDEERHDSEAVALAAEELDRVATARRARRAERWAAERRAGRRWDEAWAAASISHDYLLHLTPDELVTLEELLRQVLDRQHRAYAGGRADPPEGAEVVAVTLLAFPIDPSAT